MISTFKPELVTFDLKTYVIQPFRMGRQVNLGDLKEYFSDPGAAESILGKYVLMLLQNGHSTINADSLTCAPIGVVAGEVECCSSYVFWFSISSKRDVFL